MFTVIVPTHNSEKTILKTINNILLNLIHNEDEIIIIDDGSSDETLKILERYRDEDRVKILSQKNKGVSSARNKAIEYASTHNKFITFIDDSDQISENFFVENKKFFKQFNDIYISVTPIVILENSNKRQHSLNFRFNGKNKVVNILEKPNFIHYHMGGVVFRKELFTKENYRFDETINFWEDAKLFNTIVLKKMKYGLVHNATYFYDRNNENSLSKKAWYSNKRFEYHIENNFFKIIRESNLKYGYVISYVQFLIGKHYMEYLLEHNQNIIKHANINISNRFYLSSKMLFTHIEGNIIEKISSNNKYKQFLFKLKNLDYSVMPKSDEIKIYIHKYNVFTKKTLLSFSKESFGISVNADVLVNNKKAVVIKNKNKNVLNEFKDDFSLLYFKVEIPLINILFGFSINIIDEKNSCNYIVQRSSIFK
ncbi:glycosyltransferase family 2 protein [Staphylococcus caeli]|uniref:glycosyltransferase family 2 protein n=1 Tax=Staphylococcus caeli TaxID=2201815 RepID=UPI003F557C51